MFGTNIDTFSSIAVIVSESKEAIREHRLHVFSIFLGDNYGFRDRLINLACECI